MAQDYLNSQYAPSVYLDRVVLESKYAGDEVSATLANLTFSFKQYENEAINFANENELLRYMSIKILKVKNSELSAFLSLSKELVFFAANPDMFQVNKIPQIIIEYAFKKGFISTNTLHGGRHQLKQFFKDQQNMENIVINDPQNIKFFNRKDELLSGDVIVSSYFKYKDEISADPNHLSYFVFAGINFDSFPQLNEPLDVPVSAEVIINNKQIVSQTYAYYLENEEQWAGPTHRDTTTGQWKTGIAADEERTKRNLTRKVFYNNKIQDFRSYNIISKKTPFNFNEINKSMIGARNFYYVPRETSPISLKNTTANGISVRIDKDKLLKKHSTLYPLISNLEIKDNWIKEIKFYRRRVRTLLPPLDTNGDLPTFYFDEFEANKYVLNSSMNHVDDYVTVSSLDNELQTLKVGSYCYGVEIYFEDPLVKEMQNQADSLKALFPQVKKYYLKSILPESYDYELDQFTNFFKQAIQEVEISDPIIKFFDSIEILSEKRFTLIEKEEFVKTFFEETGTPSGVLMFLKLYENLIHIYEKLLSQTSKYSLLKEEKYFNKQSQIVSADQNPFPVFIQDIGTPMQNSAFTAISNLQEEWGIVIKDGEKPLAENPKENILTLPPTLTTKISIFSANILNYSEGLKEVAKNTGEIKNIFKGMSKEQDRKNDPSKEIRDIPIFANSKMGRSLVEEKRKTSKKPFLNTSLKEVKRSIENTPKNFTTNKKVSGEKLKDMQSRIARQKNKKNFNI